MKLAPRFSSPPSSLDPDTRNYLETLIKEIEDLFTQTASNKEPYELGTLTVTRDLSASLTTAQLQEALKTLITDIKRLGLVR